MKNPKFALLVALSLFAIHSSPFASAKPDAPNVVFFLVDDLGWTDLACYGSEFHESPNIDRLAETGMKFTQAYAACGVCSPTRAAIMTGKSPARVRILDWLPGRDPKTSKLLPPEDLPGLPLEEVTIAEVLKDNGYQTYYAGKWHLGKEGYEPERQGFDINKGGIDHGAPPGGYFSPYDNEKLPDGEYGEYLTDRLAQESVDFIRNRDKNKPFFLYHAFYTVHTPIQPDPDQLTHFEEKAESLPERSTEERFELINNAWINGKYHDNPGYAAMVKSLDDAVGAILDEVEAQGLTNDTIVIFTSDNGGLSINLFLPTPTSNKPLKYGKAWLTEGGIRVPTIIRAPGVTIPGRVSGEPIISMDFFPTILDLVGIEKRPDLHMDGKSLYNHLEGAEGVGRRDLIWYYPMYAGFQSRPSAAILARGWKLIENFEDSSLELYFLQDDIGEENNLADAYPETVLAMRKRLWQYLNDVDAPMPKFNPAFVPTLSKRNKYW